VKWPEAQAAPSVAGKSSDKQTQQERSGSARAAIADGGTSAACSAASGRARFASGCPASAGCDATRFAPAAAHGRAGRASAGASASASASSRSRTKRGAAGGPHCSSSASPVAISFISPLRSGARGPQVDDTKTGVDPVTRTWRPESTSSSALDIVSAPSSPSPAKSAKRPRTSGGAEAAQGSGRHAP